MSQYFHPRVDDIRMKNTSHPNSTVKGSTSRIERPSQDEKKITRYYYEIKFDDDDQAVLIEARKVFVIHKTPTNTICAKMDRKSKLTQAELEWITKEVACA